MSRNGVSTLSSARRPGARKTVPAVKHFLDLRDMSGKELRGMIEWSRATKASREPANRRTNRLPARCWR